MTACVFDVQIKQQPDYLDKEKLEAAIGKLRVLPGLVQPVREHACTLALH
jgi:hypothetical protein